MGCSVQKETRTLILVTLRMRTISGVSYKKQPTPLSHCRSSLYFSYKKQKGFNEQISYMSQVNFVSNLCVFSSAHYLAGDLVDVVAVHQLRCDGQIDQLASGVVVFLSVAQLGRKKEE